MEPADPLTPRALLQCAVGLFLLVATLATIDMWVGQEVKPSAPLNGETAWVPPPVVLEEDTTYIRTQVLASGDLRVTHWINSSEQLIMLDLALPDVRDAEHLVAREVRVVAAGSEAAGPEQVDGPTATYVFVGARTVQVTYLLSGAVQRSPSAPGRALVAVTALQAVHRTVLTRVTHAISAPRVLALACSRPSRDAFPEPCGTADAHGAWTVERTGERLDDTVLAQVSLGEQERRIDAGPHVRTS